MAVQACGLSRSGGIRPTLEEGAELAVSLGLFQLNWILIASAVVILALGLLLTDFRVRASGYLLFLGVAALYGVFGHLNMRSERRKNPRIHAILFSVAQIVLVLLLLVSIGYLAASANLPMQDKNLLTIDLALGLDFRAYVDFVNSRPNLIAAFATTYDSIRWQLYAVAIVLPLLGHYRRAAEFTLGFTIALAVTTIISTLIPATGAYETVGLRPADHPNFEPVVYYATLRELPLVRDGTTRLLDAFQLGPLLTFPSFHAISAVLYIWAFWPIRWFRGVSLLWNAVMLAATPIGGGHYFVDIFGGMAVAAASIWAVNRIAARLASKQNPQTWPSRLLAADAGSLIASARTDRGLLDPQSS